MNTHQRAITDEIHWLTVKDVANLFRSSESSVRRWIKKGLLKAYKPGGRDWLIDPDDCKEHLEKSSNVSD
jgi:excisionase family DNA binding protein